MKASLFQTGLLVSLLAMSTSCQETPAAHQSLQKLVITGSSTIAPLMADIGKRFEEKHPGTRVDVQTGGSSRGVFDTQTGLADIGMVSRTLHAQEAQTLEGTILATDGIGFVVHRENPVTNLTTQQVMAVYTGMISNWQSLGGRSEPIVVVNKAEGRGTLELFLRFFHLNNSDIHADVIVGDNEQGIKTVAGNPQAIAYVSIGTAESDMDRGIPIKLLSLDVIPASLATVQDGTYPITRPLMLVTTSHPSSLAKDFLAFATSRHVHDLVTQHSFIPVAS